MDSLQPMRIFVSVVQNGSLSSAGRQLGLSPASVSRHISALEEGLGCRLINRTSRKLTLTEAGELYFAKVEQILHQLAEANDSVAQLQSLPRGTLRVHSRMLIGHLFVVPALPTFLAQNPEVKVDLLLSNRVVDLVERGRLVQERAGVSKRVGGGVGGRRRGRGLRRLRFRRRRTSGAGGRQDDAHGDQHRAREEHARTPALALVQKRAPCQAGATASGENRGRRDLSTLRTPP
jgi:molybdenum-dependent DNA-binding transcriptional regulator ModE